MPPHLSPALLALLACPVSKQPLSYDAKTQELSSDAAGLVYPIRHGIPVLLIDEAHPIHGASNTNKKAPV
jgi:uncharacterized protein YbaR (Trm112 family)